MAAHGHRPDARAAPTVWDAKRLVQVEVADIGAESTRLGKADERVEVCAVDIHLGTRLMGQRADVGDRLLEHAMRRWVGHHDCGEPVTG